MRYVEADYTNQNKLLTPGKEIFWAVLSELFGNQISGLVKKLTKKSQKFDSDNAIVRV